MEMNIRKIFCTILMILIFSLIFSSKVFASEASLSVTNCNVGENFTVTVNIPQDVSAYDIGVITVTYSDGSTQSSKRAVKANMDLSWPGNYQATFPGSVAGNASITVSEVILTNSSAAVVNSNSTLRDSVTISNPTPAPPATSTPAPSESNPSSSTASNPPAENVVVNFSNISEKMYTNRNVNVRQNCGTEYGVIQTLKAGTEVTRTGVGDKNKNGYSWSRISYNGITGYVITAALTYDGPEEPETDEEEQPEETEPETPEENIDDNAEKIKEISDKFGTIPEVGINIMPFMFFGSCVACAFIMIEVKRKIAK